MLHIIQVCIYLKKTYESYEMHLICFSKVPLENHPSLPVLTSNISDQLIKKSSEFLAKNPHSILRKKKKNIPLAQLACPKKISLRPNILFLLGFNSVEDAQTACVTFYSKKILPLDPQKPPSLELEPSTC